MIPAHALRFLALASLCLPLTGCRNASEHDCERIIDRIVELELKDQGITNPAIVEKRKNDTRAQKRDELLKGCVGSRIGKHTMSCIEGAESSQEITENCLQ